MFKKENAFKLLVGSIALAILVATIGTLTSRKFFCVSDIGLCSARFGNFLGIVFVPLLFLTTVFFVRWLTSEIAFSAWKKFMKYFAPIAIVIAFFGGFNDNGGSFGIGGHGGETSMIFFVIVYIFVSLTIIIKHKIREKKQTDTIKIK